MKDNRVTCWLRKCVTLVVCVVLWLVVQLERGLTWCIARLGLLEAGTATAVMGKIVKRGDRHDAGVSDIDVYWDWLEGCDSEYLRMYRCLIEKELGIPQEARRKDPHTYAVLEPDREENLLRIVYALLGMDARLRNEWFHGMRGVLE